MAPERQGVGRVRPHPGPTVNFGGWGDPTMKYPQARYSDDVFMDGNMLWKVGVRVNGHIYGETAGTVGRGEYFVNYDKNTITLGSNPQGPSGRAGVHPGRDRLRGQRRDRLRADRAADGRRRHRCARPALAHHGQRRPHEPRTGINLGRQRRRPGQRREQERAVRYGRNQPRRLVDGNTVAYNNAARFSTSDGRCSGAGGSKFAATTDVMVSNNIYHDNYCNGIWIDVTSNNVTL